MNLVNLILRRAVTLWCLLCIVGASSAWAQAVVSLQLMPNTVAGGSGGTSTAIVTLASPAPAGGATLLIDSFNPELAATVPQVLVPAGQSAAVVTVATNALYRRYSGLGFSTTLSARNAATGAAVTATLNVTAQARPNLVVLNPDTNLSGPACAGEPGVLFDCVSGPNSVCTFRQECTRGCQGQPSQGVSFRDVCAASGPYPIVSTTKRIVGSHPGVATLQLSGAAPAGSFGLVASGSLVAAAQTRTQVAIATGATSLAAPLISAAVNRIQFAPIEGVVTIPQNINGSTYYGSRTGRAWVAVVPGVPQPARIVSHQLDTPTLRGGEVGSGRACVNQLAPAPEVGVINLTVTSDRPAVAQVLPTSLTRASECMGFSLQTSPVAANTTAPISARLGTQVVTVPLLVTATPPASSVDNVYFEPYFVVGGESSVITFVLDGRAPAGGFLITLSSDNPAALALPASVTVPAGADRVNLQIATRPVAADVLVNIALNPGAPGLAPQLEVRAAAGAPVLSGLTFAPATVGGGATTTGRIQLSGPALAPALVLLSSNHPAVLSPPSVTVPQGASSAQFTVATQAVAANTAVIISASLGSNTLLGSLTVTPGGGGGGGSLAAPSLLSPANNLRVNSGETLNFDWNDVAGASGYEIQIDNANTFSLPLSLSQTVTASQWSTTVPSQRLYWRVRALGAGSSIGPWSSVREIRVR